MKKLLLIAVLLLMTILQGCHLSARCDWFYKGENNGDVYKSRNISNSPRVGDGNCVDRFFRREVGNKIK